MFSYCDMLFRTTLLGFWFNKVPYIQFTSMVILLISAFIKPVIVLKTCSENDHDWNDGKEKSSSVDLADFEKEQKKKSFLSVVKKRWEEVVCIIFYTVFLCMVVGVTVFLYNEEPDNWGLRQWGAIVSIIAVLIGIIVVLIYNIRDRFRILGCCISFISIFISVWLLYQMFPEFHADDVSFYIGFLLLIGWIYTAGSMLYKRLK